MTQGQGENGGEPRGEQDSRDASGPLPSVLFASCSQMDGVQVTPVLVLGSSTLRSGSVSKGSAAPSPVNSSPLFPQTASSYYPERFHGMLKQSCICSSGPVQTHALLSFVFLVLTLNTNVH